MFHLDKIYMEEEFSQKAEVLQFINHIALEHQMASDEILTDLVERENMFSTEIGYKIAIPHAKTNKVKEAAIIVIRLKDEIVWGNEPVRLCFGILSPTQGDAHLKVLSKLARKLMHEDFRTRVFSAETAESMYQILQEVEEE